MSCEIAFARFPSSPGKRAGKARCDRSLRRKGSRLGPPRTCLLAVFAAAVGVVVPSAAAVVVVVDRTSHRLRPLGFGHSFSRPGSAAVAVRSVAVVDAGEFVPSPPDAAVGGVGSAAVAVLVSVAVAVAVSPSAAVVAAVDGVAAVVGSAPWLPGGSAAAFAVLLSAAAVFASHPAVVVAAVSFAAVADAPASYPIVDVAVAAAVAVVAVTVEMDKLVAADTGQHKPVSSCCQSRSTKLFIMELNFIAANRRTTLLALTEEYSPKGKLLEGISFASIPVIA